MSSQLVFLQMHLPLPVSFIHNPYLRIIEEEPSSNGKEDPNVVSGQQEALYEEHHGWGVKEVHH